MEGLKKLENEVSKMNNCSISTIFDYLKTRKELNFDNEEKSIKQMYEFICEKARKQKQDNVAIIADKVVYLWAYTYFSKSNEELGLKKETKEIPTTPNKNTKNDKEQKDKKEEENKKTEKESMQENTQMTLFEGVNE